MGDRRIGCLGVSRVICSRLKRRMGLLRHHLNPDLNLTPYVWFYRFQLFIDLDYPAKAYRTPSLFSRRDRIVLYHLADFRSRVRDLGSGMGGERGGGGARGDLGEGGESRHFPGR
jgi:hypothetical protein